MDDIPVGSIVRVNIHISRYIKLDDAYLEEDLFGRIGMVAKHTNEWRDIGELVTPWNIIVVFKNDQDRYIFSSNELEIIVIKRDSDTLLTNNQDFLELF